MRGIELLLGYFLVKVTVCDAEDEPDETVQDFMVTGFNYSKERELEVTDSPHVEDRCRGYHDVMGQWDPPFTCRTGGYLYCCGTCGFRFCCAFKSSRLDQTTCKNYDTPPWMMTGRPPPKVDVSLDTARDRTNLIVYVICGVVAIMVLIGIFTKLGLEKTHRPQRENVPRALAHVVCHPASDHMDDVGLGQHYENIQSNVAVQSLYGIQMNNMAQTSILMGQPYPAMGQITSPYDTQSLDLNKYAMLKAVAEKAHDSFYSIRQQAMEMTAKGGLPMEAADMEPEPCNPYSLPRQLNGQKYKNPRNHISQSLFYGSNITASPGLLRSWDSKDTLGLHQSCGPRKLCITEKEVHTTQYMPPQPYIVTNSKTEVTV